MSVGVSHGGIKPQTPAYFERQGEVLVPTAGSCHGSGMSKHQISNPDDKTRRLGPKEIPQYSMTRAECDRHIFISLPKYVDGISTRGVTLTPGQDTALPITRGLMLSVSSWRPNAGLVGSTSKDRGQGKRSCTVPCSTRKLWFGQEDAVCATLARIQHLNGWMGMMREGRKKEQVTKRNGQTRINEKLGSIALRSRPQQSNPA